MSALRLAVAMIASAALTTAAPSIASASPASLPDVEDEVMCPVCGVPLNQAQGAPQAERERAFIRGRISAGDSKEQIKRRLVEQYGPQVLALPRRRGFAAAAYLVPLVLGLAALLVVAFSLGRWRSRRPTRPGGGAAPLSPADRRRLDEDLARHDR